MACAPASTCGHPGTAFGQVLQIGATTSACDCEQACQNADGDGWAWNCTTKKCTLYKPAQLRIFPAAQPNGCRVGTNPGHDEPPAIDRGFWYGPVSAGDQGPNIDAEVKDLKNWWYFAFPGDYGPNCCGPGVGVYGDPLSCGTVFPGNLWHCNKVAAVAAAQSAGMGAAAAAVYANWNLQFRVAAPGGGLDYYFMPDRGPNRAQAPPFHPQGGFNSWNAFGVDDPCPCPGGGACPAPYGKTAQSEAVNQPVPHIGIGTGGTGGPPGFALPDGAKGAILTVGGNGWWSAGMLAYLVQQIKLGAFSQWDGICIDIENISNPRWDTTASVNEAWDRDRVAEFVFYLGQAVMAIQGTLENQSNRWGGWSGAKRERGISAITGLCGAYGDAASNSPNSILPWATAATDPSESPHRIWQGRCDSSGECTDGFDAGTNRCGWPCAGPPDPDNPTCLCDSEACGSAGTTCCGLWGKGTLNALAIVDGVYAPTPGCIDPYWADCPGYEEFVLKHLDYWIPQIYSVLNQASAMPAEGIGGAVWNARLQRAIALPGPAHPHLALQPASRYWCDGEPCRTNSGGVENAALGWQYFLKPGLGVKILWGLSCDAPSGPGNPKPPASNSHWGPIYEEASLPPPTDEHPGPGTTLGEAFDGSRLKEAILPEMYGALALGDDAVQEEGENPVAGAVLWVARAPMITRIRGGDWQAFSGGACLPASSPLCKDGGGQGDVERTGCCPPT
jgi:hypothetical protein